MLTIMSAATIAPSLPGIALVFEQEALAPFLSKLLLTVPALFIALSAPFVGRYIDKNGRLPLLKFGILLYIVSGTSGYYLNNIYLILAGRALLGIATGIIMTITMTLVGDYFTGNKRKKFVGYQSAFIGLAGVLFLFVGGILADRSWNMPFLIYALPLLFIPLVTLFLKEPYNEESLSERQHEKPTKLMVILYINAALLMVLMYIIPTQIPFFLKEIGVEENVNSGAALSLHSSGLVVASLLYARIKNKLSFPILFFIGFLLMSVGHFIVSSASSYLIVVISIFSSGFGFGIAISNSNFWTMEITSFENRGHVMGTLATFYFIGQFLSPVLSEPIIQWHGISTMFLSTSLLMLGLALIFLLFRKKLIQ